MPNNLFVSLMRTLVPVVAGLALGAAARVGLDLDDEAATTYVTGALTFAYYALFRGLELLAQRMAWQPLQLAAGFLLGWARPPQYVAPVTAPLRLKLDRAAMADDLAALQRIVDGDPGQGRR
jgi:hypothetical protein